MTKGRKHTRREVNAQKKMSWRRNASFNTIATPTYAWKSGGSIGLLCDVRNKINSGNMTYSCQILSCTSDCPSGTCSAACRRRVSTSVVDCKVSFHRATGVSTCLGRWSRGRFPTWGSVWKHPASTSGRTACGSVSRCAGRRIWDVRHARSAVDIESWKIPLKKEKSKQTLIAMSAFLTAALHWQLNAVAKDAKG